MYPALISDSFRYFPPNAKCSMHIRLTVLYKIQNPSWTGMIKISVSQTAQEPRMGNESCYALSTYKIINKNPHPYIFFPFHAHIWKESIIWICLLSSLTCLLSSLTPAISGFPCCCFLAQSNLLSQWAQLESNLCILSQNDM